MRAIVTACSTLFFITSYNLYVYLRFNGMLADKFMQKAYMYGIILAFSATLMLLGNSNQKSNIEIEFRKMASFIYIALLTTIIINQFGVLANPVKSIMFFNGINIAVISIILISGGKHGYYRKKN